jgi:serine/threonine protein kinase
LRHPRPTRRGAVWVNFPLSAYHENALKPGSMLAEYTIESVLGHGGFSVTYLAHDNALGAHVAIKEYLPQEIAARDGRTAFVIPRASKDAIRQYHWGLKNFVKEARALARFKHANIVRVLRFIEANGTAYTVMEYEQGQTLAAYLKEKGQRLDESSLLRIVMPILNGLHAVHAVGLLHLDIKPENIYLRRRDGSPMLIDFGSTRHAMTENQPSGRVALTHGYAPVEQYPDKGKLGPWSDVYALGATMYRCVTGKRPDDALDRYRAILDYKTDPLKPAARAAAGRYQPVLLESIDWAMQVHAQDRPQTPREFQDYLLGRTKRPRAANPVPVVAPAPRGGMRRFGQRVAQGLARATRSVIVLVLLAGCGVGGWLAWPKIAGFWPTLYHYATAVEVRRPTPPPGPAARPAHSERRHVTAAAPVEKKRPPREPTSEATPIPTALRAVLPGHADWIQAIAFAPRDHRLASASNDNTIRLWDVDSESPLAVLKQEYPANAISFSPDGRTLASAGTEGAVYLWDVANSKSVGRFDTLGYALFSVAYAPDGRTLAAAGKDRSIYVWNLLDGARRVLDGTDGAINALVFRPNGNTLVSAGADRMIRIWDLEKNVEIASLAGHKDPILALALSADGRWLASGDAGDTIRLWDMQTLTHVRTLTDASQAVLSLAFAPDGSWLVAGSADGTVYLFDVKSGRLVQTLKGHEDYVQSVAVSRDGSLLASAGRDHTVRIWQARSN